jgi:hypothetical protein
MLSLGTRSFREAEHRAELLDRAFKGAWEQAVADEAKGADLGAILKDYLREALARDLKRRFERRPGEAVYAQWWEPGEKQSLAEADLWAIRQAKASLTSNLARNDADELMEAEADRLLAEHRLPPELRQRLLTGLLEAAIKGWETAERRTLGLEPLVLLHEEPSPFGAPTAAQPSPVVRPFAAKPLASSMLEDHFTRRLAMGSMLQSVVNQERTTMRYFMEVCGDRAVDGYQRGDVTTFLNALRKLPPTYGRSPKDKERSIEQAIADADAAASERLTERTVKRHLSALTQFFRYAMDQGHITNAERVGLVEDHRFGKPAKAAKEQRDLWTPEELTTLFRSAVWTGRHASFPSVPGPHIIKDAKYWLPLLALYHGARLEEFADMRRK